MVVTLEVSKLSGWLKADANCGVEGRACDAGGERCEPEGGRACGVVAARQEACTGRDSQKAWGPRARAERTPNMANMVVTLEGSKLSGWLKADACCRVEGGHAMRGGRGASRVAGGAGVWWRHDKRHARGPTQGLGAKGTRGERTKNMASMVVTLEESKLSGWLKALAPCRVEGRACDAGGRGVRAGRRVGLGCVVAVRQAACTGKRPDSRLGGQGHARSARRTCPPWS